MGGNKKNRGVNLKKGLYKYLGKIYYPKQPQQSWQLCQERDRFYMNKYCTPMHQIYLTCDQAKNFPKPCERVANVVASCGDQIDLLHHLLLHMLPNFNNCNVSPSVSDAD